ncbi:hypothetical protein HS041_23265 [Planomonospora sp. ID67723]|uniref:hypothetical protein n=1 Tax=Planomonospora sp. ID67723 TaxID=2738134 RepID=UPI0018C3B678|nr:hypothetical protein [Planomonospora sp. ID67723]MBG0830684.1 hypothetical protein [Planomonospora sp. ID67723]
MFAIYTGVNFSELSRRRSPLLPAMALTAALAALPACSAQEAAAPPAATPATVAPTATGASSPAGTGAAPARSTGPAGPTATASAPDVFGTEFQTGPDRDWSKGRPAPFEGVLRGWITGVDADGTAEYRPIRFALSGGEDGHFEGPPEGDVLRFAAPIAEDVEYFSAYGCDGTGPTYDKATNLGTARCPRQRLIDEVKEAASLGEGGGLTRPALITTEGGRIVRVVNIYWQGGGG